MEHRCPRCGTVHERSQRYCAPCHAAYMREWRKTHPLTEAQRVKDRARSAAGNALRAGILVAQPCETCRDPDAQMHHDDYTRRLDVRWLCRPCHLAEHRAA